MSDSKAGPNTADLEALKALQADASELERIENLLNRFNVFEAIGFVEQEIKHSRFLAFLLDPRQSHSLGDHFLKRFLQECSDSAKRSSLPLTFESIDERNLDQTMVNTEVYTDEGRIDILLLNEVGKWAMIIENKVWTTERSGQLEKYYQFVKENYLNHLVRGIYLTPHGDRPSHEEYLPLSYGAVCDILDGILEDRGTTLNPEVRMSMEHYVQMVRRHILGGDFEIAKLCNEVYWKHQQAIDLIYKHRFAHLNTIFRVLQGLIDAESKRLLFDGREPYLRVGEDYVAFIVRDWNVPALRVANEGYSDSGVILVFWFYANGRNTLDLYLELGPGDEVVRERLFNMARSNPEIFKKAPESLGKYTTFFSRSILKPEFYNDATYSECEQEISRQWREFLKKDLPRIAAVLKKEEWIWESVESDSV